MTSVGSISGLFVYPVKSLAGIALSSSAVEKRGLRHDRRWMLVDEEGVFMTQRSDTRLARFRTALEADGLRIQSPSGGSICVPFTPQGVPRTVRVWKDLCDAVQVSEDVDAWFSDSLEKPCSLVYMPDDSYRATNPEFTREGDLVGFADAFPILVIGEASLDDLNSRLDEPVPLNRFRGNVIVRGWAPFQEDALGRLKIGRLELRAAKLCGRCSVTATNQETGSVGVEPLRTLAEYRLFGKNVCFGAYFVPQREGFLNVGDPVIVSM